MSNMTSESEDRTTTNGCVGSPSVQDVCSGVNVVGSSPLKKGPWTSAEDAILVEYVKKHGEGNWNAVQKHSGLSRCGKSCRLRWANHLRPDLKKAAFSPEEERQIIELHAKMGNKWARMAAELPGRTDNEIKNFWNTRIKRLQRAGLPIYPPDICLQSLNENQQNQNMGTFPSGDSTHPDLLPMNIFEIPDMEYKNFELNQQLYPPTLLDIPTSSLLAQDLGSSYSKSFRFSRMQSLKRLRESDTFPPGLSGSFSNILPAFNQYQKYGSEKIAPSLGCSSAHDHNPYANYPLLPGSHALQNGNSSSSEPISWAMKLELPSLQYSDPQAGRWGTPFSPLPSLESVDALIQSPLPEHTQSDHLSPRNSGLLEAVLYESQTLKNSKNNSCHRTSNASVMTGDVDSLSQNLHLTEWEVYVDPISPLGHSAASVFSEYTPTPISGSSLDEPPQSIETMPRCNVKQEAVDWVSTEYDWKDEDSNQILYSRPDFLLGSNCFGPNSEQCKDNSMLKDAIGKLLGEDFSNDYKQMGTTDASSSQGCSSGSCA